MFDVLSGDCGVVDGTDKDGFVGLFVLVTATISFYLL